MSEAERPLAIQRRMLRAYVSFMGSAAPRSRVLEHDGVSAAIVPETPDRSVPNSVTYASAAALAGALSELADAYREAGVRAWTVWAPEHDREAIAALERAGHAFDGSPAAMQLELDEFASRDLGDLDYDAEGDLDTLGRVNDAAYGHAPGTGMAQSLTRPPDGVELRLYRARAAGRVASVLGTIDQPPSGPGEGPDCGIYFVATEPAYGGRGLATRLLAAALGDARERGCATSSLQSSAQGEPIYAALGYRQCFRYSLYERRDRAAG